MATLTQQRIGSLYDQFRSIEVAFSKEVILETGLQASKTAIKWNGSFLSCHLFSCSLKLARVLIPLTPEKLTEMQNYGGTIPLKLSFRRKEGMRFVDLNFFVQSKMVNFSEYNDLGSQLYLASFNFTSHPPDDLIEIIGLLLEANVNATKRRDVRIPLSPDTIQRLGLASKNALVVIDKAPRNGIVVDISFSGAKVIIGGYDSSLERRTAILQIKHLRGEAINLQGQVVRAESLEGRADIGTIALAFKLETLPLSYKVMINSCLYTR